MRKPNRELRLDILKKMEKTIDNLLKRSDSADLYMVGAKCQEDEAYYKGESEAYIQARNMVAEVFIELDESIAEVFEHHRDY